LVCVIVSSIKFLDHRLSLNMGGDGGSISQRSEMVRTRRKLTNDTDPLVQNLNRWTTCALSTQPLGPSVKVVTDPLGFLYDKEAALKQLILVREKSDARNKAFEMSHLRRHKDLVDCKLFFDKDGGKQAKNEERRFFSCPITNVIANGSRKFVAMRTCGCVLAEKALREMPASSTCLVCSTPLQRPVFFKLDLKATAKDDNKHILHDTEAARGAESAEGAKAGGEEEKKEKKDEEKADKESEVDELDGELIYLNPPVEEQEALRKRLEARIIKEDAARKLAKEEKRKAKKDKEGTEAQGSQKESRKRKEKDQDKKQKEDKKARIQAPIVGGGIKWNEVDVKEKYKTEAFKSLFLSKDQRDERPLFTSTKQMNGNGR